MGSVSIFNFDNYKMRKKILESNTKLNGLKCASSPITGKYFNRVLASCSAQICTNHMQSCFDYTVLELHKLKTALLKSFTPITNTYRKLICFSRGLS